MNSHIEICRIAGIPIYLDMFFVLLLCVFAFPYFTTGDQQLMSVGIIVIVGLLISILLHELGHALVARFFGVRTAEIELTGLGGLARFANALPRSPFARSLIFLGGPAVNLLLWQGLMLGAYSIAGSGFGIAGGTALTLALNNFWLLVFNLLPAFPLDGGRTLEALLTAVLSPAWAIRIVSVLGLVCAAGCVLMALQGAFWLLLLAFVLYQHNWAALSSVGGIKGGR